MATLIEAIRPFGPRLKLNNPLPLAALVRWIALWTAINEPIIWLVLHSLKAALLYFTCLGRLVKLDCGLRQDIIRPQAFQDCIDNGATLSFERVGLKALWNAAIPKTAWNDDRPKACCAIRNGTRIHTGFL